MVRIGGGWDTLENYLNRHDPCRCNAAKNHKTPSNRGVYQTFQPSARRPSNSSNLQAYDVTTSSRQLPATPGQTDDNTNRSDAPKTPQVSRRNSSVTPRVDSLRRSEEYTSKTHSNKAQSPASVRRSHSSVSASTPRRPQSALSTPKRPSSPLVTQNKNTIDRPRRERRHSLTSGALHKHFNSNSDLSATEPVTFKKPEPVKPQPKRPQSAGPDSHSRTAALSRENSFNRSAAERGRSPARTDSDVQNQARSRSVGASTLRKHLVNNFSVSSQNEPDNADVLMISRDKGGHHILGNNNSETTSTMMATNGLSKGSERVLASARVRLASDRQILPNKPKSMVRSQSGESKTMTERQDSDESISSNSERNFDRPTLKRQSSVSSVVSVGSTIDETIADCPVPEPNHELNQHMELLFEEYRKIEKGVEDDSTKNNTKKPSSGRKLPASPAKKANPSASRKTSAPVQSSTSKSGSRTPTTQRRASLSTSSSSSSISSCMSSGYRGSSTVQPQREFSTISSRNSPPGTPNATRRSVTPVRPTPIRPTASYAQPASFVDAPVYAKSPQVSRSSSMRMDRSRSQSRSQTPNPETNTPQVRVPLRSKTPVVKMKTDDIKSRIDTGLRNRSVSRSNSQRMTSADVVRRSSSLSRAAVNKQVGNTMSLSTPRPRSRSKDDLLDTDDAPVERRSRADVTRKRDSFIQSEGRRSASREVKSESASGLPNGHLSHEESTSRKPSTGLLLEREPRRSLPATPAMMTAVPPLEPVTVEIPVDKPYDSPEQSNPPGYAATPRKDDRSGPRTRIPRPSSAQAQRIPDSEMNNLKRFDSGVDINISPTETYSNHGDDDTYLPWQKHAEAVSLSPRNLAYAMASAVDNSDEYY